MTEEEAKTKWCPQVRNSNDLNGQAVNRYANGGDFVEPDHTCVGSRCMAWRWDDGRGDGPVEEIECLAHELPDRGPAFKWAAGRDRDKWGLFPRLGFCGLAGKP